MGVGSDVRQVRLLYLLFLKGHLVVSRAALFEPLSQPNRRVPSVPCRERARDNDQSAAEPIDGLDPGDL